MGEQIHAEDAGTKEVAAYLIDWLYACSEKPDRTRIDALIFRRDAIRTDMDSMK